MRHQHEMSSAEYRRWAVRQMRERDWQRHVVTEARDRGWLTYHVFDSRRSDPGFPDLVLVHPAHGVAYLELKTERGQVRPAQRRWLAALQAAGQPAYVARPRDLDAVLALLDGETVTIGPVFATGG